jgi:hypothetical protein
MAKFTVDIEFTRKYRKTFTIYADDAGEAEQKVTSIVEGWSDVADVEVVDVDEE